MAEILDRPNVTLTMTLRLNELEARALYALQEYGADSFLQAFYKNLGRNALEPFESGLRSIFTSVREQMPPYFTRINQARAVFEKKAES